MRVIDLNADLGEDPAGIVRDEALMAYISSASIACGGHAGDEDGMDAMLSAALRLGVSVGAHPSHPDRANFGRVDTGATADEVRAFVGAQVGALARAATARGLALRHVKPHGALYHAAEDRGIAMAIAAGVSDVARGAALVGFEGSAAIEAWRHAGIEAWPEGFADRRVAGGRLVPRGRPDALIHDPAEAAAQAVRLARSGLCETLCIHSDTPDAVEIARVIRQELERAGFTVRAPCRR